MKMNKYCTNCNSELKVINGNYTCKECGMVIEDLVISDYQETYNINEDITYNNSFNDNKSNYLSSFVPKTLYGLVYKNDKYIKYSLYKLHVQCMYDNVQRSYDLISNTIDNIGSMYSNKVLYTAKCLWVEIMKTKRIFRASIRKGLILSCIYYSNIHHNIPIEPEEICAHVNCITMKDFNKSHNIFKEIINDNIEYKALLTKIISLEDYLHYFLIKLDINFCLNSLTETIQKKYSENILKFNDNNYSTKNITCALIYKYYYNESKDPRDKLFITKICNISYATLVKILKIIE